MAGDTELSPCQGVEHAVREPQGDRGAACPGGKDAESRILRTLWGLAPTSTPGRAREIADAAVSLADAGGMGSVSRWLPWLRTWG
jgi:hypothetical protein